jgi:DNA replication protein DnaC
MGATTSPVNTRIISNTEAWLDSTCPLCSGAGFVVRDVPPGHPDFERLIPCRCRRKDFQSRYQEELYRMSNIGQLSRMTFDNFVPEGVGLNAAGQANLRGAFEKTLAFAHNPNGWLILLGGYGCGKTHLAAAVANARLAEGEPVLFVVVPDLLDYLRTSFAPTSEQSYSEQFEKVRSAPLLILDDLGTESATPWAQEKLFQILNHRYNARLTTVITTNCKLEEIDIRLRSRMVDPDLSMVVTILATDFRGVGEGCAPTSVLSSLSQHQDQTFETFRVTRPELSDEFRENLQQAYQMARDYAEGPRFWLALSGLPGTGKTHLAAAIANHRTQQGYPAVFVVVPDLLDHLRATFSPSSTCSYDRRFEEVKTAELLVLDDLGTESATAWAREKLYQLFNHRYNAKLATVITTALHPDEIDPRLAARMFDELRSTFFVITAPAYRASKPKGAAPQPQVPARGRRRASS